MNSKAMLSNENIQRKVNWNQNHLLKFFYNTRINKILHFFILHNILF
jgi:hypothetical protein